MNTYKVEIEFTPSSGQPSSASFEIKADSEKKALSQGRSRAKALHPRSKIKDIWAAQEVR